MRFYVCCWNWNVILTQIRRNRMLDDLIFSSNKSLETIIYVLLQNLASHCLLSQLILVMFAFPCGSHLHLSSFWCVSMRETWGAFWRCWLEGFGSGHVHGEPHSVTRWTNSRMNQIRLWQNRNIIVSKANRLKVTKYFGKEPCWGN